MDRSLELIREARAQSKWDNYSAGLLKERISLLPQRNFIERMEMASVLGDSSTFSSIRLRLVSDIIAAKAWSLGEAGGVAGFREISKDGEHLLRGISERETGTLVDELVGKVCASGISESFASVAGKLGLQDEAAHWGEISERMKAKQAGRDSREFIVDGKAVDARTVTGGLIAGEIEMVARQVEHQPPLTDGDLKPGRLQDHEVLSRFFSYVSWILIAVCLGFVAAYRFRVFLMEAPAGGSRRAGIAGNLRVVGHFPEFSRHLQPRKPPDLAGDIVLGAGSGVCGRDGVARVGVCRFQGVRAILV